MTRQQEIETLRRRYNAAMAVHKLKTANLIHARLVKLVAAQMRADERKPRRAA